MKAALFYAVHRRLKLRYLLQSLAFLPLVLVWKPFMKTGELFIGPVVIGTAVAWLALLLKSPGTHATSASEPVYLASRGVPRTRSLLLSWAGSLTLGLLILAAWVCLSELQTPAAERSVRLHAGTVEWLEKRGRPFEFTHDTYRRGFELWKRRSEARQSEWFPTGVALEGVGIVPWLYAVLFFVFGVVAIPEPRTMKLWSLHGPFGGFILVLMLGLLYWGVQHLRLPSLSDWMIVAAVLWPVQLVLGALAVTALLGMRVLRTRQRADLT